MADLVQEEYKHLWDVYKCLDTEYETRCMLFEEDFDQLSLSTPIICEMTTRDAASTLAHMKPELAVQICMRLLCCTDGKHFVASMLSEMSASKAGCILCEIGVLEKEYDRDSEYFPFYLDNVLDALSARSAANILANMQSKDAAIILANILAELLEDRAMFLPMPDRRCHLEMVADVIAEMENTEGAAGILEEIDE